jgi:hypothetical protein
MGWLMFHSYIVGPFVVADGMVVLKERSSEPVIRPGLQVDPEIAFRSLFDSGLDCVAAVRKHGVSFELGGVGFDYDRLRAETICLIARLVEEFDWVIRKDVLDRRVCTIADLKARVLYREQRRAEYRKRSTEPGRS